MFSIYAVVMNDGIRYRHFLGNEESEPVAKDRAGAAVGAFAHYAYVKDSRGATIFLIRHPDYESQRHAGQVLPLRP